MFKQGDRVISIDEQIGTVIEINEHEYPLKVLWDNGLYTTFLLDGRWSPKDEEPSIKILNQAIEGNDDKWFDLENTIFGKE